jgi:transcriptional regulator with XRE-family HTH domain
MEQTIFSPMPPTLDEIARARIREWMRTTGATQVMLAGRIGKTQAWMSRYLSGELDADLESLRGMAAAFEHSLSALLEAPTNPIEAELITLYRALHPDARKALLDLLRLWANPPSRKLPTRFRG